MSVAARQPVHVDDREFHVAPFRPRPLLSVALAFIAGIVASEFLGDAAVGGLCVGLLPAIGALVSVVVLAALRRGSGYVLPVLLMVAALGLGHARHQHAVRLPPNHVAHLVTERPVLTRLAGQIVTQPTMTLGEKRNPFLSFDPLPRTRFVLDARELRTADPPAAISGYVRVGVEAESIGARMGETVVVTGQLYRPLGPRNPGETDWARWSRLQNVYAGLSVEGAVHVQRIGVGGEGAGRLISWLRGYVRSLLFEPFAQGGSDRPVRLLDAMVLGHRSAAGRQLNEAFLRTGAIHFLAVSGFHVGVLAGTVWFLTRRVLRRGVRTTALATMIVIVLYALIVEHNAPILRAATMGVLLCLALLTRRPFCGVNWLAFSALCILTWNPLEVFRAGFQLSFVLVLALLTIVPRAYRLVVYRQREDAVPADADTWARLIARQLWRWLVGLAIVCVCAWIISLPLVLLHFGRFAPWGALQSIVVSPLVMLTIVLGFLTLILSAVVPPVGAVVGILLRNLTDLLLWVVDHLSQLPGTLVEVPRPPAALVVATYALFLLLLGVWWWQRSRVGGEDSRAERRRGRWWAAASRRPGLIPAGTPRASLPTLLRLPTLPRLLTLLLLLAGGAIPCLWVGWLILPVAETGRDYAIRVLSVGSGAAVLVTGPECDGLLYDVGTIHNFDAGETVVQAARVLGIGRLEALVISHANYDHYSGTPTVLRELRTGRLLWNDYFEASVDENPAMRRLLDLLPVESPPHAALRAGDRLMLGEASVEILWPPGSLGESWQPNDRSLVLRVAANGRSALLPGDIEREAIRELLSLHESGQIDVRSDVLLAPHHGSVVPVDTAAFYEAVHPSVIINSTGRERPKLTALVREALGEDVRLFSTDAVGAVTVRISSQGEINVETPFVSEDGGQRGREG